MSHCWKSHVTDRKYNAFIYLRCFQLICRSRTLKIVPRITHLCFKAFYSIISGKRSTIVECIVTDKRTAVDDIYCAELTKPNTRVVTCNYGPCPTRYIMFAIFVVFKVQ